MAQTINPAVTEERKCADDAAAQIVMADCCLLLALCCLSVEHILIDGIELEGNCVDDQREYAQANADVGNHIDRTRRGEHDWRDKNGAHETCHSPL